MARSDIEVYTKLGAEVSVAAPGTLLPSDIADWPVKVVSNFEEALATSDVVGLLRLQKERGSGAFVPTLGEFTSTFGLTAARARLLRPETLIMHPGPMNRGVEIDSLVADSSAAVIEHQVRNGVPVRMAVLYLTTAGASLEGVSHE